MAATTRSKSKTAKKSSTIAQPLTNRVVKSSKAKETASKKKIKNNHRAATQPLADHDEPEAPRTPHHERTAEAYAARTKTAWKADPLELLRQYAPRPDEKDEITGRPTFAKFGQADPDPLPSDQWGIRVLDPLAHFAEFTPDDVDAAVAEVGEVMDKKHRVGVDPNSRYRQLMPSDIRAAEQNMRAKMKARKEAEGKPELTYEQFITELVNTLPEHMTGRVPKKDLIDFAIAQHNKLIAVEHKLKYDVDPSLKHVLRRNDQLEQRVGQLEQLIKELQLANGGK